MHFRLSGLTSGLGGDFGSEDLESCYLPDLLLRDCDGGGCSAPGWKQNSRDEFGLALFPLPLPWRRFAPRGGQMG